MRKFILIIAIILKACAVSAQVPVYLPSDSGSKVHFVIKNFGFNTGGSFSGLKGKIHFDPAKPASCDFSVSVDVTTIDTDSEMRDKHLKEIGYFDAEKYPTINLKSTKVIASATSGSYTITGNITIKGVSKPVQFIFSATKKDNGYLFDGEFEINRLDFNVGNKSMSMQDNVKISLSVFAKK